MNLFTKFRTLLNRRQMPQIDGRLWQASQQAYATFKVQHPRWANSLFDETFVMGHGLPIIQQARREDQLSTAAALASAYTQQMTYYRESARQAHIRQLIPVAAAFLQHLNNELDPPVARTTASVTLVSQS